MAARSHLAPAPGDSRLSVKLNNTVMAQRLQRVVSVPARPAPPPPAAKGNRGQYLSTISRPNVILKNNNMPKKKPPPRPPPPKIRPNCKATPTYDEVMAEISVGLPPPPKRDSLRLTINFNSNANGVADGPSLIDFTTPPSSPSPTQQSCSDGLSVNSFSSDGTTSNSQWGSGNNSQVESGFEDDFDPFASPPPVPSNFSILPKSASFTTLSSSENISQNRTVVTSKPTIIRPSKPKPARPAQPVVKKTVAPASRKNELASVDNWGDWNSSTERDDDRCETPPMPSVPPPPAPVLDEQDSVPVPELPALPPRPGQSQKECEKPYAIALYEYPAQYPDDLPLQPNDTVYLENCVNNEWYYGTCRGRRGMFPANFVQIVVPLGKTQRNNQVTALYTFHPETADDLALNEGDTVTVLQRLNQDWLYGECRGARGQFPSSFVDYIPDV